MKLIRKNTDRFENERLNITMKDIPCLDSSWHYHPQFELLYISQSTGIRFVGDSVSQFSPGDLVLVGPNLPHLWRNDPSYYKEGDESRVKTIVIKFSKDFIGKGTFDNAEFYSIGHMLEESKFGISFGRTISRKFHNDLMEIIDLSPAGQSIMLLNILLQLSLAEEKTVLSSTDMRQYTTDNSQRIDDILKYISDNYSTYISLNDVAEIACMTTNSFCRFFKRMTNKSYTQFLNEVRIRNAARLLVQNEELSVSEIADMVGYTSITNFNRQFKQILNNTPRDFRQLHGSGTLVY
ncbi:AraC family transcriptional regulator [Mangrovibacterium sp.]|uniref:AraC family transcriptional regulator n=1 Tax=Mangrovibacterium sp. TaxID=1961364 RepID=UPI0035671251